MENEIKKQDWSAEEKAKLIESKREHFASVNEACASEFDTFKPCETCSFLNGDCHKTCGVITKHLSWARMAIEPKPFAV